MPTLVERLFGREERHDSGVPLAYAPNGQAIYPNLTWAPGGAERINSHEYLSYVTAAYQANGVVFAAILARSLLFAEARFAFRQMRGGRPGDLFGTPALGVLERPWENGTTGELLSRMEQDASLAGNFYGHRHESGIDRWRPDWVEIVSQSRDDNPASPRRLLGYVYFPNGERRNGDFFPASEVIHYSPIPDPLSQFRGMSWLSPVVREIDGDSAMTAHKNKFFEHAATPNMIIKLQGQLSDKAMERFEKALEVRHQGVDNAYRTMLLEGGADATVVGNSFEQMSFSTVQAAGENRILMASGVPGIVVGAKEGLQAATYSNYAQAMRRFVDLTMRPLWRMAAASVSSVIAVPAGSELWYDTNDIAALREDAEKRAEIVTKNAAAIRMLIEAGYDPDAASAAVTSDDLTMLTGKHTGLVSVQLQEPGSQPAAQ